MSKELSVEHMNVSSNKCDADEIENTDDETTLLLQKEELSHTINTCSTRL